MSAAWRVIGGERPKPDDRLDVILQETAETAFVHGGEYFHGAPVATLGGLAVPLGRLGKILGDADAILIGKSDKVLRVCIASVRTGKELGIHAFGGSLRLSERGSWEGSGGCGNQGNGENERVGELLPVALNKIPPECS